MLVTRHCQRVLCCSATCRWPRQLKLASPLGTYITANIRPYRHPTFPSSARPTPALPILTGPSVQSALCCRASGDSHSTGSSSNRGQQATQQPSLLARLAAAARALLITARRMFYILIAIVVLVAALPTLLSTTKAGNRAACWAANRALAPGTVTVDSISLGWQSPVSINGLVVNQGAPHTSRELISIDRISTAEPLYKVVRNAGAATVVVKQPTFDITLDETDGQLRLAKLGEEAKFPFALPAVGSHAAAADAAASTNDAAASDSAATGQPVASTSSAQEAADATVSGTSNKAADAASSKQQDAAAKAAATSKPKAASSKITTTAAQPTSSSAAAQKAVAADLAAGRAVAPSALKQRLACADACVEFSAELRAWSTDVVVTDGLLLLSAELKEAIGDHVHTVAAIGHTQTADLAAELNLDSSWVEAGPDADQLSIRELRSATPMLLVTDSDRVVANARGWWLGGRCALLERPVEAQAELTPELASMTLAQVNPLLSGAFKLQERGRIAATLTPQDLRLPCDSALLQVEPLKLQLGQGQMMGQLFDLLKLPQQGRQGQQQRQQGQGQGQQQQVEAWTGPMEVVVESSGRVHVHRLDMLMGNPARGGIANAATGIHLALWGEVDIMGDTLRMKVGLPASTLALVGIRGLPPAYVLPLELSGSLTAPGLHWAAAARQMAVLSTLQLSRASAGLVPASISSGAGGGGLLGRAVGAANRMITQAIGQVDARVQAELQDVPEALPVPWATRAAALPPAS